MDNEQQTIYDAALRADDFNEEHADELSDIEEYAPFKETFDATLVAVENALHQQAVDTSVVAPDKEEQKLAMGEVVIKYALRAAPKAQLLDKPQLEAGLSHPLTYIVMANADLAEARAFEMKELMKNNLSILTNIKDEDITEMEAEIQKFKDIKPVPKEKIETKKSLGTDPLPGLLKILNNCMKQMGMLIHSYLPQLATEWDNFVKKGAPLGRRHLSIVVRYLDSVTGVNLRNVNVTLTKGDLNLVKKSTILGYVRAYSMEEGNWKITAQYEGYEDDVRNNIGISETNIVRLEVRLVKKSG